MTVRKCPKMQGWYCVFEFNTAEKCKESECIIHTLVASVAHC